MKNMLHFHRCNRKFLGHRKRPRTIKIATKSPEALQGFHFSSTNGNEVISLVGLSIAYQQLVPNFSRISAHLNVKRKKGGLKHFNLTEVELAVVDQQNGSLTNSLVLPLLRRAGTPVIDTDVCDRQVRCVLQQE